MCRSMLVRLHGDRRHTELVHLDLEVQTPSAPPPPLPALHTDRSSTTCPRWRIAQTAMDDRAHTLLHLFTFPRWHIEHLDLEVRKRVALISWRQQREEERAAAKAAAQQEADAARGAGAQRAARDQRQQQQQQQREAQRQEVGACSTAHSPCKWPAVVLHTAPASGLLQY